MRRALTAVLVLLLAGMLALEPAVPAVAESTRQHGRPADVTVLGVNVRGQEHQGHHFAAHALSSLVLRVHWKTLIGRYRQRLELIAPDGAVYQTLTTTIDNAQGQAFVETRVPVAGSWITQYGLFGRWHVKVYLDEVPTPQTTATFTLAR